MASIFDVMVLKDGISDDSVEVVLEAVHCCFSVTALMSFLVASGLNLKSIPYSSMCHMFPLQAMK